MERRGTVEVRDGSTDGAHHHAMKDRALLERARTALARVGLSDRETTIPSELSHGQRRQLEVAVALTLSPKAFLMD